LNQELPQNEPLIQRTQNFSLSTLLTMDADHYVNKVWPLAFYISRKNAAKWQMNAARALGNQGDPDNVPLLIPSLNNSPHEIVRGMSAWSLGRLGGARAKAALEVQRSRENGSVKEEIEQALEII
jgi:epoxyqueuosine reductase